MVTVRTPQRDRPVRPRGGWEQKIAAYALVSPFFILFALVGLFPLLYTSWVSLHEWNLLGGQGAFVGLDNFGAVLQDRQFWIALRNTLSIFVITMIPQLVLATAIAAALDQNLRAGTFWRMGVLLPYVIMPVAIALIFSNLFGDRYGLVNTLLGQLGIPPIAWHSDVLASHVALATMVNFRWTGYAALILLAGMQAVPRDFYEAATVDGAGPLRRFFSITLPQIRPTFIFIVITMTVGGLQIFDEPRLYDTVGQGGPDSQWLTLTLYLYKTGWTNLNFGEAAAIAWLLFLLIMLIGIANFLLTRRLASDESSGGSA